MITSLANDKVKYARSLRRRRQRGREGRFVIEGVRLLEDAMRAGCPPALVLFRPEQLQHNDRAQELLAQARSASVPCYAISAAVLDALSDTTSPQGILAVVELPRLPAPSPRRLVLVADTIRDPGNLGTLLRTAAAAGVDEALLGPGTVDPYNSKVLRAGMGAHFRLPMSAGLEWPDIAARLEGLRVRLADAQGDMPHDQVDWTVPSALIVGGEAHGGSPSALAMAETRIQIPMSAGTESLNAAVAAAVILFEAARQRRAGHGRH